MEDGKFIVFLMLLPLFGAFATIPAPPTNGTSAEHEERRQAAIQARLDDWQELSENGAAYTRCQQRTFRYCGSDINYHVLSQSLPTHSADVEMYRQAARERIAQEPDAATRAILAASLEWQISEIQRRGEIVSRASRTGQHITLADLDGPMPNWPMGRPANANTEW